jgi:hypothetical protein
MEPLQGGKLRDLLPLPRQTNSEFSELDINLLVAISQGCVALDALIVAR